MAIAAYLNTVGRFVLLQDAKLVTSWLLPRGRFKIITGTAANTAWKAISDYRAQVVSLAFPVKLNDTVLYVSDDNAREFEKRSLAYYTRWSKLAKKIAQDWDVSTADAHEEMLDTLTARYQGSHERHGMMQHEYLAGCNRVFSQQAKLGPRDSAPRYTYCSFGPSTKTEPKPLCYVRLESSLWLWLMDVDVALRSAVVSKLQWLAGRSTLYGHTTDKQYINRKYQRDIREIALPRYCSSLKVIGRSKALAIVQALADKLDAFYVKNLKKNKIDGSQTTRLGMIKLLSKVGTTVEQVQEAFDAPLDIDALARKVRG